MWPNSLNKKYLNSALEKFSVCYRMRERTSERDDVSLLSTKLLRNKKNVRMEWELLFLSLLLLLCDERKRTLSICGRWLMAQNRIHFTLKYFLYWKVDKNLCFVTKCVFSSSSLWFAFKAVKFTFHISPFNNKS
jgi:hypothetical protein